MSLRSGPVSIVRVARGPVRYDGRDRTRLELAEVRPRNERWKTIAALVFFPLAAILHHAIFRPHTCMLNIPGGANSATDYYPSVIAKWLGSDPSPWFAAVGAFVAYKVGPRNPALRPWIVAFLIAFLPLSIWVWDLPGSGQIVCHTLHDGRHALHSWHLYVLGTILYFPLGYVLTRRRSMIVARPPSASAVRRHRDPLNGWYWDPAQPGQAAPTRDPAGQV